MNIKIPLLIGIIAAVVAGGIFFFRGNGTTLAPGGASSGLIVGKNALYVADQPPESAVSIAVVYLEKPGFAVIHEDNGGKPGQILGTSNLIQAGETKNTPSGSISRMTRDGETLYVMLHFDNGDGKFDAAQDKPAQDKVGGAPVMMIIEISQDTVKPGAINL